MGIDELDPTRLGLATTLAAQLHRSQFRKGTGVPYLSHLMAVAGLVAEDEGSEDEIVAALLHDAAEDQGGEATLVLIEDSLGATVAAIVRDCSDSLLGLGEEKASWRTRKEAAIASLPSLSPSALRVTAADKLHNTRATADELGLGVADVWDRFKAGREGFLWYHREVADVLVGVLPESRSVRLLHEELRRLEATGS